MKSPTTAQLQELIRSTQGRQTHVTLTSYLMRAILVELLERRGDCEQPRTRNERGKETK